ncbi:MAG TPA: RidA family protein, partial [Saprospiraceae bacterium]|nr:RidA family protein [Saprospiraceae bacterium]
MKKVWVFIILVLPVFLSAQTPEERLVKLGLTLPPASAPAANYVNVVRTGNLLYLAGKGPTAPDGQWITGKLGLDVTIQDGYEAAKSVALAHIAVLKNELGDLSKVKRIVKVNGYVNSTPDFIEQPKVMNGYSDMMVAVFGDQGKHARSSVGVCALPMNIAVEVEVIVEV